MAATSGIDTHAQNGTLRLWLASVLDEHGAATRFAFVRQGGPEAASAARLALRQLGITENIPLTVLTDGDAGLRAIHRQLAPHAEHVLDWFHLSMRFQNLKQMAKGIKGLTEGTIRGQANADSMPNYGERFRSGSRISTEFTESAVNEIIAKRMNKKQQMRWNRHTVQAFLEVRIHVLNRTLEDAFCHWHAGFRSLASSSQTAMAA
jgi:hypothetical protein